VVEQPVDTRLLRILIVEDVPRDADLLQRAMRRDGLAFEAVVTDTREGFLHALETFRPEIVLSDYSMPRFSGREALDLKQQHTPDIPFIVVTGSINEETAVDCIKCGADDYVTKAHLARLLPAIQGALCKKSLQKAERQAREAMRASEARLRSALAASNIGPWEWNLKTNAVYLSPEWKRQIGYEDTELGNTFEAWADRLHPEDRDPTMAALERYLEACRRGRDGMLAVEFRLRHRDGSHRWILTHAEAFRDDAGQPERMIGCHVDITTRRQTEEALRQVQKLEAIATLAGGVAHDFNNLLTVINGYTDLAMGQVPTDSTLQGDLAEIRTAGERGTALTRQLLAFSRHRRECPGQQSGQDAAPPGRGAHRTGHPTCPGTGESSGRPRPDGTGDHEPGRQCARRHAGRR